MSTVSSFWLRSQLKTYSSKSDTDRDFKAKQGLEDTKKELASVKTAKDLLVQKVTKTEHDLMAVKQNATRIEYEVNQQLKKWKITLQHLRNHIPNC